MQINKDLRVTDGAYYNLDLDTIAKNGIYSTDEIVVGRWIDGKPIYRKVYKITGRTINYTNNGWSLTVDTIINFGQLINGGGAISFSGGYRPMGYAGWNALYASTSYVNQWWFEVQTNGKIYLYSVLGSSSGNSTTIRDSYIVLEYTKSTD